MTIREWLALSPLFYKECLIDQVDMVGERHVCISVVIPLPIGGMYREVLDLDAVIQESDRRP